MLLKKTLAEAVPPGRGCSVPLRLAICGTKDIPALKNLRPGYYDDALIGRRLERGELCLLGWSGERAVFSCWVLKEPGAPPFLGRQLTLPAGAGLLVEGYVPPDVRARGLCRQALASLSFLGGSGLRDVYALVASWHGTVRRIFAAAGFKPAGAVGRWNVPGWKRVFAEGSIRCDGNDEVRIE